VERRVRCCHGKKRYTEQMAKTLCDHWKTVKVKGRKTRSGRRGLKRQKTMHYYLCPNCGFYHLGHNSYG
jgi:ribosomal protein L32